MATLEVNVTNEGVNIDDPNDQSVAIRDAILLAGTTGYSNSVCFPGSIYYVKQNIFSATPGSRRITIRGDGPSTIFKIHSSASTSVQQTIFQVQGSGDGTTASPLNLAGNFVFRDLTLDGGVTYTNGVPDSGSLRPVRWFLFDRATLITLENVTIQHTYGYGIYGECWWDSVLNNVQFARVGDPDNGKPSMILVPLSSRPLATTNCNNIRLVVCRFEGHRYKALVIGQYSQAIYLLGCKFHGPFDPTTFFPPQVSYAQLEILDNCYGISLTGLRMANWNNSHIRAFDTYGLALTSSILSGAGSGVSPVNAYAVDLQQCCYCSITNNNFGASLSRRADAATPRPLQFVSAISRMLTSLNRPKGLCMGLPGGEVASSCWKTWNCGPLRSASTWPLSIGFSPRQT